MIRYRESGKLGHVSFRIQVLLDGKKVGAIYPVLNGYRYFPDGHRTHGGKTYPTIAEVKKSLEEE